MMKEQAALQYNGCDYEVGTSREGAAGRWRFNLKISRNGETVFEYDGPPEFPTSTVAENVGVRHARTWINAYLGKYR
jgi:hypothetical protein